MINTMCIANKAQEGACIYASHSYVYITDCLIQYNMGSTGGAVKISDGSFISCNNCTFDTNFANYGGAIIFTDGGYGNFTKSLFTGNISPYYGPAIFAISSSHTGIIVNTTNFLSNIVGISGVISIVQSAGYLYSSNFTTNIAMNYSPGISTSMGNLTIHGCRFYNQSGFYGSFISLGTLSYAEIYDSEFELGNSNEGGALVIATSLAYIVRCSFKHMKGTHGGTISVNTMAYLYMTDVSIYNSTCSNKGGAIYDIESTLVLTNVNFENFQDSAIYADKASLIQATNSSFINGGSIENGGGIMCISCISIIITNSNFSYLNAKSGGSIYMYYQENQAKPSCLISSTTFQYNSAIQGGAITSQDYNLTILNSNFSYNSATGSDDLWGSAGSILFSCSINDKCNLFLTGSAFEDNYARELGGCITWSGTQPLMLSNTFANNSAIYGPEIASFPVAMKLYFNGEIFIEDFKLVDVAPGQLVSTFLEIVLLDHYGQIVKTENQTSVALYSNKTDAIISGTTVVTALNGIVIFDNYYIYGEPNSNLTIIVKSSEMSDSENINIPVSLRDCLIGESLSSKACVECNKGQYSLDPSGPCLECLAEAVCYGNYSMVPKQGYWRSNMYSTTFYKCPFVDACLGGGDNFSLTGECAQGYRSNLCQSCDKGYSHSSTSLCQKCPSMEKNIIYLSLIIIFITLCVCALVYINISMADKPASNYTILIKILLNYIQIIGVVASLNLDWPDFALEYLKIQETAGSLSQQSFSFDCFVADKYNRTNNQVYFDKIILYLLMPVFIIIVCLFLWSIVALIKLDAKYIKNHFVGSVVIIVFLLHTIIIRVSLAPFSCKKIENDYWLNDDLSIKCWTGMHKVYTLSLALPGLIIWCIFVPFTAIFFTFKNKMKFEQLEIKQRYGYIIAGYNYERFYWEFVIMYRKVFVISASLFFGSLSVELQTLSVLIILLVSSYMQADLKPFYSPELNKMEFRSILVSVVTIYCGLYYLTPNVSTTGRIILFILLVSFNTTFFGYWAYYFIKEFSKAAIDIFKSIIRRFRKKVVPEVEMEERDEEKEKEKFKVGYPIVHIETNDNNIIVDDKDRENDFEEAKISCDVEKVEQLRVVGESRRGALTFISNQREHSSVICKKPGTRMTVRYNAFDDSL
ncbi:hypothetical protein SteCoe_22963 [Stentor coeruleus]|uniref:DUF7630 domain-containing protein n=1 Tax=Stentor coeruleus TaxID=5963 RepID=A0A1R2BL25_9CILI|nr:hypothetical protein SteCoe_22963 [Stentor coeruleus]